MAEDKKNVLQKLKDGLDDKEEQLAIISLFVRLGVVVWSGFIVTLNYISIPGYSSEPKDITFPASLLTGALATFGLEGSKKSSKKDDKVAMVDGMVQTIRVVTPIKIEGAEVIDPKPKKMKKLLPLLLLASSPVLADIKQEFVTSAQITVDMPYVVTNKVGTTYSLSGNNITPSVTVGDSTTSGKIGGINVGSLTNGVPAMIQTDTTVTTSGSAFSKTESVIMGDATPSTVTPSSGIAALPVLSGQTTVGSGGTAGSLALTSLSSGVHTCTAGGSGTSCIGSTKVTITID